MTPRGMDLLNAGAELNFGTMDKTSTEVLVAGNGCM